MRKITFLFIVIAFTQCVSVSQLENSGSKNHTIDFSNSKVEFVETRAVAGTGVTLADALAMEKAKWGNDISLINIIEQNKSSKFLIFTVGIEKNYVYDVVRITKK
jgi:hypothetical protein